MGLQSTSPHLIFMELKCSVNFLIFSPAFFKYGRIFSEISIFSLYPGIYFANSFFGSLLSSNGWVVYLKCKINQTSMQGLDTMNLIFFDDFCKLFIF